MIQIDQTRRNDTFSLPSTEEISFFFSFFFSPSSLSLARSFTRSLRLYPRDRSGTDRSFEEAVARRWQTAWRWATSLPCVNESPRPPPPCSPLLLSPPRLSQFSSVLALQSFLSPPRLPWNSVNRVVSNRFLRGTDESASSEIRSPRKCFVYICI